VSAPTEQSACSSEPVGWGFLGAGQMSRVMSGVLPAADNARLVAVGARDEARAAAMRPELDYAAYGSYKAVLADPGVEVVYIALANDAHLPWTVAALEAGKHVLCEKPLGMSAGEVDRMAAVAQETGRLLVEASWYRWHPRVVLAQERLAAGAIGAVRHVSAGFTFGGVAADNYRNLPGKGGGALYDVGCYALSAMLWAVGRGLPAEVVARQDLAPTGVDLTTDAVLTWDDDTEGDMRAGITGGEGQWLVIRGERGEIELRDAPYTSWIGRATELWVSDGRGTERIPVPPADPYLQMLRAVTARIRGGDDWVLPPAESRDTAAVIDACFASARNGSQPAQLG